MSEPELLQEKDRLEKEIADQSVFTSGESYKRLEEIDNEMSQARVIVDILAGNPPHERVLGLLAEREELLANLSLLKNNNML